MHRISTVGMFHTQLSYCVTQFVDKDKQVSHRALCSFQSTHVVLCPRSPSTPTPPQLAVAVIKGLLRLWPRTDSGKEIILLQELEELLELTPSASYPELLVCTLIHLVACGAFSDAGYGGERPRLRCTQDVLCYRLCRCVESSHFQVMDVTHRLLPTACHALLTAWQHMTCQVAERTLFLWQNEYIYLQFLQQYRAQVLPRFYPVLFANQTHWNPMVICPSRKSSFCFSS